MAVSHGMGPMLLILPVFIPARFIYLVTTEWIVGEDKGFPLLTFSMDTMISGASVAGLACFR